MLATLDCLPCLARQALSGAQASAPDLVLQKQIVQHALTLLSQADLTQHPVVYSMQVYDAIADLSQHPDPYAQMKRDSNALALKLLPRIRQLIQESTDPLGAAAHAAIAGNVIDAGVNTGFDIQRDLEHILSIPFGLNHLPILRERLRPGVKILYLCDNAGEIILDRLLIEQLLTFGTHITAAVKSSPILNDATLEDAQAAGLPGLCDVIESGSGVVGIDWTKASPELRGHYEAADIVIAKGHGHYESMDTEQHPGLFCLLKAKCNLVAQTLNIKLGDLALAHIPTLRS